MIAELAELEFGPSVAHSIIIVENEDGEGGSWDVYHGSPEKVEAAASALREKEERDRVQRVESWKKHGWHGVWYNKLYEYTIFVIHADGTRKDYSLAEQDTGLA